MLDLEHDWHDVYAQWLFVCSSNTAKDRQWAADASNAVTQSQNRQTSTTQQIAAANELGVDNYVVCRYASGSTKWSDWQASPVFYSHGGNKYWTNYDGFGHRNFKLSENLLGRLQQLLQLVKSMDVLGENGSGSYFITRHDAPYTMVKPTEPGYGPNYTAVAPDPFIVTDGLGDVRYSEGSDYESYPPEFKVSAYDGNIASMHAALGGVGSIAPDNLAPFPEPETGPNPVAPPTTPDAPIPPHFPEIDPPPMDVEK